MASAASTTNQSRDPSIARSEISQPAADCSAPAMRLVANIDVMIIYSASLRATKGGTLCVGATQRAYFLPSHKCT